MRVPVSSDSSTFRRFPSSVLFVLWTVCLELLRASKLLSCTGSKLCRVIFWLHSWLLSHKFPRAWSSSLRLFWVHSLWFFRWVFHQLDCKASRVGYGFQLCCSVPWGLQRWASWNKLQLNEEFRNFKLHFRQIGVGFWVFLWHWLQSQGNCWRSCRSQLLFPALVVLVFVACFLVVFCPGVDPILAYSKPAGGIGALHDQEAEVLVFLQYSDLRAFLNPGHRTTCHRVDRFHQKSVQRDWGLALVQGALHGRRQQVRARPKICFKEDFRQSLFAAYSDSLPQDFNFYKLKIFINVKYSQINEPDTFVLK